MQGVDSIDVAYGVEILGCVLIRGVGPKSDQNERADERNPHEYRGLRDMKKVCKTFMRRFDPGPRLHFFQRHLRLYGPLLLR